MKSLVAALLTACASAEFLFEDTPNCSYTETCTAGGIEGVCVSVSAGCCSGTTTAGLCSGSSDIKCCTKNTCTTPQGTGKCMQKSACTGTSYSGYCTGPSDLQCCVGSSVVCDTDCCSTLASRTKQTYTFYQNTGHFIGGSGSWAVNTHGYSGAGDGYLNPDYQCVVNTGPLPKGYYTLSACVNVMHTDVTRPCSFVLTPNDESAMCGRDSFLIHGCQACTSGDYTQPPIGGCSAGCVVIDHDDRKKLRVGDTLHVISYEPTVLQ